MKKLIRWAGVVVCVIQLGGCFAADVLSDLISECGDISFDDLEQGNDPVSQDCHDAIADQLPGAETNFSTSKMVALGAEIDGSNRPVLYVGGINASGTALTAADFSDATVTAIQGGVETVLAAGEFAVESLQNISGDVASLSYVTDYSASMTDGDIDDAADIFDDLIGVDVFPAIYEAEVYNFSSVVTTRQAFTETRQEILDALARDDDVEREYTSLYDGMGTALTSLSTRTRPVRILLVATDGLENDSDEFSKDEVISTINANRIFVVMIGTLFSDVGELEDLAGNLGIFFYAQTYLETRSQVSVLVETVKNSVQLTLDEAYQNADSIQIDVGDLSLDVAME